MSKSEEIKLWAGNYKETAKKNFNRAELLKQEGHSQMRKHDELMAQAEELENKEQNNG